MDQINFINQGGLHVYQDTLNYMQKAYSSAISAITKCIGDNIIISGVQDTGVNITDGWIVLNGEVLPFKGGLKADNIYIDDTDIQDEQFDDNIRKPTYYNRVARGTNSGGVPLVQFVRLNNQKSQQESLSILNQSCNNTFQSIQQQIDTLKLTLLTTGTIVMWSGALDKVPQGWALCDGKTVSGFITPNLSGKFIVGYDKNDIDYNSIGKQGGEKKHILTASEMPLHDHIMHGKGIITNIDNIGTNYLSRGKNNAYGWGGGDADKLGASNVPDTTMRTGDMGSDEPHENRPPFYTLAYIIKL